MSQIFRFDRLINNNLDRFNRFSIMRINNNFRHDLNNIKNLVFNRNNKKFIRFSKKLWKKNLTKNIKNLRDFINIIF